jgi:GcrA cell cycle regulator
MDWDTAAIEKLRALLAKGDSVTQIAIQMGTSKNAICGKVHRLNLAARASPIRVREPGSLPARPKPPKRIRGGTLPVIASLPTADPSSTPKRLCGRPMASIVVPPVPPPAAPRIELLSGQCCWPFGEPRTASFRFCDAPCNPLRSYCDEHRARAVVNARPKAPAYPAL